MSNSNWIEALADDNTNSETWDRTGTLQGVYVQKKTNVGPNESNIYTIRTDKGEVGVWGSTVIDARMTTVPVGSEVKIESLGEVKSEKTGRTFKNFKIYWRPAPFVEAGVKPKVQPVTPGEAGADDEPPVESYDGLFGEDK